jgi:hypothetical protein
MNKLILSGIFAIALTISSCTKSDCIACEKYGKLAGATDICEENYKTIDPTTTLTWAEFKAYATSNSSFGCKVK